ncbi:hypothetical protein [Agrococcus citreus]|uniref:Lipoprotein n=1 Tax=Agrococcus citreus TaxID=84643 RepID=A0ABN1YRF8_9MICO
MFRSSARASQLRRSLAAIAVASAAALALSGCVLFGGAFPDRTDAGATAEPAEPVAEAPGPDTRCHENVFWGGADDKGVRLPTTAAYRSGFALPGVVDGFDLLCASSWTASTNDCQMDFARAYLDAGVDGGRMREIDEALMAWAGEHGLERTDIGMSDNTRSFGITVSGDGAVATLLQWDAVSRYEGAVELQRHADLAGIPLDGADVSVSWQVCPALQGWQSPPPVE